MNPLVTVICINYNQKRYLKEAVESVIRQTYQPVQLILVDDASNDGSQEEIRLLQDHYPDIITLLLQDNVGNCAAFNRGLEFADGRYIIDLAADDILLPDRIKTGVAELKQQGGDVHFSDAEIISEHGDHLRFHSEKFPHDQVPRGDIYLNVIRNYFICPPTVMFSRRVIDSLGGYDELLTYEDFDFWVRSSRNFRYVYSPRVLVKKREVKDSLSSQQFKRFGRHGKSTLAVCNKILELNRTRGEQRALSKRISYEIWLNLRLLNMDMALQFCWLWIRNKTKRY